MPNSRQGNAFVELALGLPLIALLFLGTLDFARAFHTGVKVAAAARAGALTGSRAKASADDTGAITAAARDAIPELPAAVVTVSKLCGCATGELDNCAAVSCSGKRTWVKVRVSSDFATTCPYPGIPSSFPVAAEAIMRAE
jgi:Flp pilus assembly protein TadG